MVKNKEERMHVMLKIGNLTWVVLIAALVGIFASQASQASPAKPQAVEIGLNSVEVVFGGPSEIVLEATFTVHNPNKYEVAVKNPEYELWTGTMNLGGKKIPTTIYVPAKTTVKFKSVVGIVVFKSLIVPLLLQGKSPGEATVTLLPQWKSMGGALPNPALSEVWGKVTAEETKYRAAGRATMARGNQEMVVEFDSQR